MPINYRKYPPDWHAFSRAIRLERAQNRCESCGALNHTPAPWRPSTRIVLTVAHCCTCDPPCRDASHVLALCQREHLARDQDLHARHAAETRRRRKEAQGQLTFLKETPMNDALRWCRHCGDALDPNDYSEAWDESLCLECYDVAHYDATGWLEDDPPCPT